LSYFEPHPPWKRIYASAATQSVSIAVCCTSKCSAIWVYSAIIDNDIFPVEVCFWDCIHSGTDWGREILNTWNFRTSQQLT